MSRRNAAKLTQADRPEFVEGTWGPPNAAGYKTFQQRYIVLVPSATTEPWAIVVPAEVLQAHDESHLRRVYRSGAIDTGTRRASPPKRVRDALAEKWGNVCAYCDRPFGTLVSGPRRQTFTLRREWDHRLPYAYLQANPDENWIPACHVCNRLKQDRVLNTLIEARDQLRDLWRQHDYCDADRPYDPSPTGDY